MTNGQTPDARPSSLHRRLTVALADATDRARLAEVIAGDPGAVGLDGSLPSVRSEDLWRAADGFAKERAADRLELRARLDAVAARTMHDCDTAHHQHEHLLGWRRTLLDGADWATQLLGELDGHLGAVRAAQAALDERRAEQRAAQQDLERVLEQRHAVAAAIEEADGELGDLGGTGMDESGLRRELEAAGRAVHEAHEVHGAARARLEELQVESHGLDVRREAAAAVDPISVGPDAAEVAAIVAVRDALASLQSVIIDGEVDPDAVALAAAWSDLVEDLHQVGGTAEGPSDDELGQARRRAEAAYQRLAELDALKAASALSDDERAVLDAAHAAVLTAEEQIGRRRRAARAQHDLTRAREAERALLDQHGFGGYLDVVLTGGRAASDDPHRPAVEREHFEASLALEALDRAGRVSPDLTHLRAERTRLLGHVVDLLGVDPGANVLPLLRSHRRVSGVVRAPLADALTAAGGLLVGVSLEDAGLRFLAAHPLPGPDVDAEEDSPAVDERSAALAGELADAQSEVDRSAEALQMAGRSVGAFESELSVRAEEDLVRMKRSAAAEQLRTQIDALSATLRQAEDDARRSIETAAEATGSASATFDHAANDVGELARRARKLAEELPIDQRPEGDPLRTLPVLISSLRAHSEILQPEIDRAVAAVESASTQLGEELAACRMAGHGDDGPQAEDLVAGLQQLLEAEPAGVLMVLDEPFVGTDEPTRDGLLEVVRAGTTRRPIVLLTEDAEVLGWAIELPAEEGTALPADALLARIRRANDGLAPPPALPVSTPAAVDLTTPASSRPSTSPSPSPSPTAPRWAGQR